MSEIILTDEYNDSAVNAAEVEDSSCVKGAVTWDETLYPDSDGFINLPDFLLKLADEKGNVYTSESLNDCDWAPITMSTVTISETTVKLQAWTTEGGQTLHLKLTTGDDYSA